jgi:hypothetical protein
MGSFFEADQLARDLGYPCANPAFWKWCERVGLEAPFDRPMVFEYEDVAKVVQVVR